MQQNIVLLLLVALTGVTYTAKLPPEYLICKHGDPNFSECLKNAVQDAFIKLENGISGLNVPPLQPLNIPSVTIGEGKGVVNVVQKYKNFFLHGLTTGKIGKFDVKLTGNDLSIKFDIDFSEVHFEADYSFNGRILLLPIVGDGRCRVALEQLKAKFALQAEVYEKKGKKYLKVKDTTVKLAPGKATYDFKNLFNGDERLGAEMNKILNDNWKDVYYDIGDQYAIVIQTVLGDYANKIFSQVPYDELF